MRTIRNWGPLRRSPIPIEHVRDRATSDPEQAAYMKQLEDVLLACIAELPGPKPDILMLLLKGFDSQEISALSETSSPAVRGHINRAREILRRRLREKGFGDV
jgi:DNA-directed RNA polymerase specialized sigma24 family protein